MEPSLNNHEAVVAELQKKEQQLKLVMEIDQIRDEYHEPVGMLSAVVNLMAQSFETDLCLLSLIEQETGEVELKGMSKRNPSLGHLDELTSRKLSTAAVSLNQTEVWHPHTPILQDAHLPAGLEIAAVPIILGEKQRLGALLLVRHGRPFSPPEIDTLNMVEDLIDSAVMQGYNYDKLQQRNKELEAIYRIDHIRDRQRTFDGLLNAVTHELQHTIEAEMGFLMLYDNAGANLDMRASTHDDLFNISQYEEIVQQTAAESLQKGKLVCRNNLGEPLKAVMCLPLILNERIIGVMGVAHPQNGRRFGTHERRLLTAVGSQMDTAIFESMEKRHLRSVLGRSVDPRVMEKLLESSETDFLKGERRILTVLYADIRGSTSLAENTEPELLVGFINDYLGSMNEVVLSEKGTLDKFVGDEVMAVFGAPVSQPDHALRAVKAGLQMQIKHRQVIERWRKKGVDAAPIGVGVATGELIVGEMGSHQRTDYTVLGRAANLGARICSAAQAGQVLISPATYELVRNHIKVSPVEGLQFKGVAGKTTVYSVHKVLD